MITYVLYNILSLAQSMFFIFKLKNIVKLHRFKYFIKATLFN